MGSRETERCECHTTLLTTGERAEELKACRAGNLEVAEVLAVFLFCTAWVLVCEEADGREMRKEGIDMMLGKVATVYVGSAKVA
jgi:hypothetical protein